MFTLHVYWLLVACVPGLLMLAALGLGRMEQALSYDTATATATTAAKCLEGAKALDVRTLAREGMPEALDYLHRRQALQPAPVARPGRLYADPFAAEFETRLAVQAVRLQHSRTNPQFPETRHVNRV
jgi:hypothetical protein